MLCSCTDMSVNILSKFVVSSSSLICGIKGGVIFFCANFCQSMDYSQLVYTIEPMMYLKKWMILNRLHSFYFKHGGFTRPQTFINISFQQLFDDGMCTAVQVFWQCKLRIITIRVLNMVSNLFIQYFLMQFFLIPM